MSFSPAISSGRAPRRLASDLSVTFDAALPSQFDETAQRLGVAVAALGPHHREEWHGGPDLLFGAELQPVGNDLEAATEQLYARVLERTGQTGLCRIWNYVPHINARPAEGGLENYRAFSRARARAFESAWGADFTRHLPAASAVGGPDGMLAVVFATADARPEAVENPEQTPAYRYPAEHGPRSPSFSRATRVRGRAAEWIFISGTAAIKGHQTVAPGQLDPQLACTINNLQLVSEACGSGIDLGAQSGWRRRFKVYLRHAGDFARSQAALNAGLLRPEDEVIWLHADICRADLEVEIEATLVRPL